MAVLLKVALLLIYLAVLFILARLLEVVAWYEQGQISRQLLDPMTLSVLRLKALLEQRGVSYNNMVEKKELVDLVEATGNVTSSEIEATTVDMEEDVQITNYTSDIDFYEQVEDAKDSMWLVEIMTDTGGILSDTSWHMIKQKVGKFGVRFGRYNCQKNARLCTRKGWFSSRLVLALPENYRTKANVAIYTYPGPIRITSLFDWIKSNVNGQLKTIDDSKELEENWLNFDSSLNPDVRVLFISTLSSVPLFLSALSVKFPGRVKLGTVKTDTVKGKEIMKKLDIKSTPSYVIITRDRKYVYGQKRSETMTFRALEMFLKSVYPSMNDIFVVSLVFTNIASVFEFSLTTGSLMRRSIKLILCMFQYNLMLFLFWILVLTLLQTPFFIKICYLILRCLRYFTLAPLFSFVRKDILFYSYHKTLALTTLVCMSVFIVLCKSKYRQSEDESADDEESEWWNFTNLRTLNYYNGWEMMRLRPFDQIFNPTFGGPSIMDDYEPVHSVNSTDYIKWLPVWMYREYECSCNLVKESFDKVKPVVNETNDASTVCKECKELTPIVLDAEPHGSCMCGCKGQFEETGVEDNQKYIPPKTSSVILEGPGLGLSYDQPWDGSTKTNVKLKKVENFNRCFIRPSMYRQSLQCVICLDSFSQQALVRGLPCKHVFHDQCILAWLYRDNHFCPVCRWPSFQSKEQDYVNDLHSE